MFHCAVRQRVSAADMFRSACAHRTYPYCSNPTWNLREYFAVSRDLVCMKKKQQFNVILLFTVGCDPICKVVEFYLFIRLSCWMLMDDNLLELQMIYFLLAYILELSLDPSLKVVQSINQNLQFRGTIFSVIRDYTVIYLK